MECIPSLQANYHHKITCTKFEGIYKAIEACNWEESFWDKDSDGQACLFDKVVIDIHQSCIPNKYATFNGKDPPWLNDHKRRLIKKKNTAFQKYRKDGRTNVNYTNLETSKVGLTDAINALAINIITLLPHLKLTGP